MREGSPITYESVKSTDWQTEELRIRRKSVEVRN